MGKKIKYSCVGHGVLRAFILTMFALIVYSLLISVISVGPKVNSIFYIILTLISIIYGTICATIKAGSNGWLMGILVGLFYIVALFIVSILCGKEFAFGVKEITRVIMATLVGALSGMITVNL
ncbi:TIGR04086 family membrane protein [Clostridium senegalense]|uniref:TIGR04086 family membrane protein n=1 Tax=Clostridium senegalense TaxID=1465809 RepID=UPI000289CCB6|nr:TIGR04086 family membrane protein [Clostridium senegalense]MBU5225692.1 TIGR04086 family membrane protein [Clostridium senegalense]